MKAQQRRPTRSKGPRPRRLVPRGRGLSPQRGAWRPHRHGIGLLIGFGVLSVAGLIVMLLVGALSGESIQRLDGRILLTLRAADDPSVPAGPVWLHGVGRDITALGSISILTLTSLTVVSVLLLSHRTELAFLFLATVVTGAMLTFGLKLTVSRLRPDVVPLTVVLPMGSFPSGHAMMSAVIYLTTGALVIRVGNHAPLGTYPVLTGIVLTVLVGLSRLYLGVHWPTDVLTGWALGAGWATLSWFALLRWEAARAPVPFAIKIRKRADPGRTEWPTTKDSPRG